jgi:hypothetical protein
MNPKTDSDPPDPIKELQAGIAFWRAKRWPDDFDSAEYKEWAAETKDFSDAWWNPFLRHLHSSRALRPATYAEVTERFDERRAALRAAWGTDCAPYSDLDIIGVTWAQVGGFCDLVGELKPMKSLASPVFTSKFCHFMLPKVFPIVDTEGAGNKWPRYQLYFEYVQSLWATTPEDTRTDLIGIMTKILKGAGAKLDSDFPMVNKIVELQLIGRQHPQ